MEISIFGLGYVGAVSLACLARDGHSVTGVDIDTTKLDLIRSGKSPVIESGMPELMEKVVGEGRVRLTDNSIEAIKETTVSFVCVGTPSQDNGSQDQGAVLRLTEQLGKALKEKSAHHLLVYRSTLAPGTVKEALIPMLEEVSGKTEGVDFDVCFQPEFLREGSSIQDYDFPPFTVVGAESERSQQIIRELFGHLPAEIVLTEIATAETVKYFCNIFHALKISFANEVARLCESFNVDGRAVMELLCKDKQLNISTAYLMPGFAFGGSCLPKDMRAMDYIAKMNDVDIPVLKGVLPSNRVHLDHAFNKIMESGKRKIGFIGLSFKSGTDDLRESPLVDLAEKLIGKGLDLKIYDPEVNISKLIGANKKFIDKHIPHISNLMATSVDGILADSELIVVGLSDSDLVDRLLVTATAEQLVLDLVNISNKGQLKARYLGACW